MLVILFLQFLSLRAFAQDTRNNDVEEKDIEIPANISDWYSTGIQVKKNDLVFLNVYGVISVGLFAGEVNGAGTYNPFLVGYSWYKDIPHGALICSNNNERVFAQYKADLQNDNTLFHCVSELASTENLIGNLFTDEYIGNFFQPQSDEELKLLINDADYGNNLGSFKVSIIICHNFFPQVGDIVVYWDINNYLSHSGYVSEVDGCKITGINCYLQSFFNYGTPSLNMNPNDLVTRFGYWTAYHTDRENGRHIQEITLDREVAPVSADVAPAKIPEGITDKGILIGFYHNYLKYIGDEARLGHNCHGYTFDAIDQEKTNYSGSYSFYQIAGYGKWNSNNHIDWQWNQGVAAEFILVDNGYKEIHAEDSEGIQHYKEEKSTKNIKYVLSN